MSRFDQEWALVPKGARFTAVLVALAFALLIGGMFIIPGLHDPKAFLYVWPFFLLAWIGDAAAVLLIAVRTYRLVFYPELLGGQYQIKPVE